MKVGDKVKYIKSDIYKFDYPILNSTYTIIEIVRSGHLVLEEDEYQLLYDPRCFISIKTERKQKLKKD